MDLPFTPRQFFAVMADYNVATWPAPPLLWLGALATLTFLAWRGPAASRVASLFLALSWGWMAIAYHLAFFARINPAALLFAALFAAAGALFAWEGVVRRRLVFEMRARPSTAAGLALAALALAGYPLLSLAAGHAYPATPTFGLPCPTTLYTVGMLAFLRRPHPRLPLLVPVAWSLVGASAAWLLGVPEDLTLLLAFALGCWLLVTARGGAARDASRPVGPASVERP